jgi:Uma2 family endonuclease
MPATATKKAHSPPGARAWSKAMRDLPDLPYKVETNAQGQLLLSPPKPEHGFSQLSIGKTLDIDTPGQSATEFAVHTSDGVKVPDVIWISAERRAEIPDGAEASPVMPELCVEVLSDSNTEAEMADKRRLYFEGGAHEVWLVSQSERKTSRVRFFGPEGETEQSQLAPDFPQRIQT